MAAWIKYDQLSLEDWLQLLESSRHLTAQLMNVLADSLPCRGCELLHHLSRKERRLSTSTLDENVAGTGFPIIHWLLLASVFSRCLVPLSLCNSSQMCWKNTRTDFQSSQVFRDVSIFLMTSSFLEGNLEKLHLSVFFPVAFWTHWPSSSQHRWRAAKMS